MKLAMIGKSSSSDGFGGVGCVTVEQTWNPFLFKFVFWSGCKFKIVFIDLIACCLGEVVGWSWTKYAAIMLKQDRLMTLT